MDELEKFIKNNRDDLDARVPADDLWQDIDAKLHGKRAARRVFYPWIWKAASLVLLAAVIGLLIDRQIHKTSPNTVNRSNERLTELRQVESYYSSMISLKRNEMQGFLQANPDFRKSFNQDIAHLDSLYTGLKSELANCYNDKIVDAMIVNLQLRIEILNQQLNILQGIQKTKENEKVKI